MKVFKKAYELIGGTPLLELTNVYKKYNLQGKIYAKLEYFNTTGSVKDRIAYQMIKDAIETGGNYNGCRLFGLFGCFILGKA